jgi:3',5'-cyclic-AMP phosphodiesterase
MANKVMLIAQFTDLHIVRRGALVLDRVDTAARLKACIVTLKALNPQSDLLLLTGDLVDHGQPEEYAHLRELLAPVAIPTPRHSGA